MPIGIDAPVVVEPAVLGGDDRVPQRLGHLGEGHEDPALDVELGQQLVVVVVDLGADQRLERLQRRDGGQRAGQDREGPQRGHRRRRLPPAVIQCRPRSGATATTVGCPGTRDAGPAPNASYRMPCGTHYTGQAPSRWRAAWPCDNARHRIAPCAHHGWSTFSSAGSSRMRRSPKSSTPTSPPRRARSTWASIPPPTACTSAACCRCWRCAGPSWPGTGPSCWSAAAPASSAIRRARRASAR